MDQAKGHIRTIATAEDPSLVRCFRGHQKTVNAVNFSRQMKQVVSGGLDGLVEVWNFKPQIRPFKFVGHKGPVNDVLFNAASTMILSCGDDRQIKIWKNSVNGKHKSIKAHSGPVLKISLSENEEFFVSCSSDKTIKMWNSEGKFKQSYLGHTNWVRECQISPDQRLLLSCSDDKTVKLWDLQKASVSATFLQHKSQILTCKFTPDGTCVAGGAMDGTIKLWDTRISKMIQHYNAHEQAVNRLAFHPLGYHMASVSNDNKIKIWDLKHGNLGWTLYGHQGAIKSIDFNYKGDYFATTGQDKLVMIWMSNFDKEINEKGRKVQSNFRQKTNGQGIQPLFKSNKLGIQEQYCNLDADSQSNPQKENLHNGAKERQTKGPNIGELMSFELQKIVNQLEIVTRSLDFMDRHVTQHENIIDKLFMNEKADGILMQMEERGLMKQQIYNSAWEAQKNMEARNESIIPSDNQFNYQQGDGEVDQQYEDFLEEEEHKRKIFQQQLRDDELDFNENQVNVMKEQFE